MFNAELSRDIAVPAGVAWSLLVDWGSCFGQGEMSDDEAGAAARGNLNFLLDSLKGYLEKSP